MHPSSPTRWCRRVAGFIAACCSLFASARSFAVDYTWGSSTTGGSWSVTTNWDPAGAPTSADTALLGDATANRTVFYNAAASGTLTGLSFTQTTTGVLNELQVQRAIRVTNAVTLGASSGTSRLLLQGTAANITGTFSGGVNVNSGGVFSLGIFNPSGTSTNLVPSLNGNVTVGGGLFELSALVAQGSGTSNAGTHTLTGNLTMTSGTVNFVNTGNADRRLTISGNVSITGGSISAAGTGNSFQLTGATIVFAPQSFESGKFTISLQNLGDQTFTGSTSLGAVNIRGTGVKTVSSQSISNLQFIDGSTVLNSRTTLKLASNITSTNVPIGASFSQNADTNGNVEFGIDADAYTLDFSSAGVWTPTKFAATGNPLQVGTISNTIWALSGTAGTIKASGYNFATSGTTTLTTTVGPGLVLVATGGTSTNVLSGSGTIDPTSTFRFAGTTTVSGTPAILSSDRAIGNLEVTSGALRLGNTFTSMQNVRVSGGSLDLLSKSLTVPSVQLTGGTITTGTLTSSGTYDMQAGTLAAALLGSGSLAKTGTGTIVLSGANGYSGTTTLAGGVLSLGVAEIEGTSGPLGTNTAAGAIVLSGGTLQYTASNQFDYSPRFSTAAGQQYAIDTNGQVVTWATALGSSGGSLTKSGSGTLTLTNANTYDGGTTIAGGTLQLGNGSTTGSVVGDITNNATLAFNRSDSFTFGAVISGSGAVTKAGAGTLTLTNASTHTGTTTVTAGTLALGDGGTAGSVAGPIALASGASLVINRSNDLTLSGAISGTGSLTKQGAGTLTLAGTTTLAGLTLADLTGSTNALQVQRSLSVTNAVVLSASSGMARISLTPTSSSMVTGSFAGGFTLSPGGRLSMGIYTYGNGLSAGSNVNGNVTIDGGYLDVADFTTGSSGWTNGNINDFLNGTLTMSSGTIGFANNAHRLNVTGNATITGGVLAGGANAQLFLSGTSNQLDFTTVSTNSVVGLFADTATATSNAPLQILQLRGNGAKTFTSTAAGNAVATLQILGGTASNTFRLGSSLSIGSIATTNFSNGVSGGTTRLGIDAASYALTVAGTFVPGNSGQSGITNTYWTLAGSSGTIQAAAFNFNTSTGGTYATVDVGPGLVLTSTGGNAAANVLSGSGTIDATSTFRYAGSAATATPATLVSTRMIGDLEVTSGALRINGLTGAQAVRVTGGTLDLNNSGYTFTSARLAGGSITGGTLTSAGLFNLLSGTASAVLAGTGSLSKTTSGTVTLAAANTYAGSTSVTAGTLLVNGDQSAAVGAVTVDLGATLGGSGTIGGATTVNGILSPGNSPGVLTLAELALGSTSTTLMEITGTSRGVGYDGVTITQTDGLGYGGTLSLSLTNTFADNTTFDLFAFSGLLSGSFSSVTATGSYGSLTFTNDGLGVWSSGPTNVAGQTMTFSQSTGDLVIVPEPAGFVLLAVGAGIVVWNRRRR